MSRRPADRSILAVAPMMVPAMAGAAGIAADRFGPGPGVWIWVGLTVLGVIFSVIQARAGRGRIAGLIILGDPGGLGGAWHHAWWSTVAPDDLSRGVRADSAPRPAWLRGVPIETAVYREESGRPGGQGTTRTVLAVTAVSDGLDWRPASGNVAAWIGGDRTDLEPGRPVEIAGSLAPIEGPRNPGERDARDGWRAIGVRLRIATDGPVGVWPDPSGRVWPWTYCLGRLRAWSHRTLVSGLDARVAPLASALLLGRREEVDPALNDAFARTGTTHLLAISGLHLQALACLIFGVARVLAIRRRPSFWAVILGSTAYALLVGLAPSVVRSLAMTLTVCVAGLIDRPTRRANILAIALLFTLWLNPAHLFDVGCQLSFLAVAAILWGVPAVLAILRRGPEHPLDRVERYYEPGWKRRARRAGRWLVEGMTVSALVWALALPMTGLRFHLTSPISVFLNLPLVPITSLAMLAAGLTLGLSAVWPPLAIPVAWGCRVLLAITDWIVRWGAARSWGHRFGPGPGVGWTLAFYAGLGLAAAASLNGRGPRTRRVAWSAFAGIAAMTLIVPAWPSSPGQPVAEILAVGHGLAVTVRSGDGRTLLYDAGRMGDPRAGRRLIAPVLWARGVTRLDLVILSHADSDHYNALPDLLDRIPIAGVAVAPGFLGESNPGASDLLDLVRARGIPVRMIAAGDAWTLGKDVQLSVLHPPATPMPGTTDNARSVVLAVESAGRRLLLTGDLEGAGLLDLTRVPAPTIDAFLSPHHGGRSSNPIWLYDWARPGLVVSSQSPPMSGASDALSSVEARGVPVWRTWQRGAVRLRWTSTGLVADGFLNDTHPPPSRDPR